jgi:hypothetical protein
MDLIHRKDDRQNQNKLMPTVHKNGETGELAVEFFDDDIFIELVVTSLYAAVHSYMPVNMKWHDVERSMYRPASCVSAVQ